MSRRKGPVDDEPDRVSRVDSDVAPQRIAMPSLPKQPDRTVAKTRWNLSPIATHPARPNQHDRFPGSAYRAPREDDE
jgi:hypothetical protein